MLRVENLTKSYKVANGRHYVFRDVTIEFPDGANIGIIGPNGAGKSTFLRILGGIDHPDSGRIVTNYTFSWPLGLRGGFVGHMSGRDNCRMICHLYGIDRKIIPQRLEYIKELTQIGKYFEEPVRYYSSGMSSRLGFGLSMAFDFDYFLIDEITAVGDAHFKQLAKQTLEEKAKRSKVIMVSHSMNDIRNFCDVGVLAKDGMITVYDNLDDAVEAYLPKTHESSIADEVIEERFEISSLKLTDDIDDSLIKQKQAMAQQLEALEEKVRSPNCQIEGDAASVHFQLGEIYRLLNSAKRAVDHYKESLELNGFQIIPHVRLAQEYMSMDKLQLAEDHLIQAKKLDSGHATTNALLAKYYLRREDFEKARLAQLEAIRAMPKNGNFWYTLARIYYALGQQDDAIDAIVKALQFKGDNPAFYRLLSRYLFEMGAHLPALEARHKSSTIPHVLQQSIDYADISEKITQIDLRISG